ncbi:MAG TPA: acyl carrier protein [Phycisphaerae bacterium]|jgi:acyl carrier protein|nr:acyl carrier protein [Phycisphaerae bacterium]HOB74519.1 acyl carrier protein [Phycisphaerae bacterium]HOJ54211.1 acyl carrier protein [Phycisphaerae bacterium]HOL26598.1 acyl carrier protein [Phycisphaerae bacterium]HPP20332.1 acyl carrier protein [Phycisphaerae bacterium]
MTGEPVDRVVAGVLKDLLGYAGPISDDLGPPDVQGWDSVAHISIIEELESRLGVKFTTEELVAMGDVRAIKETLARHHAREPQPG